MDFIAYGEDSNALIRLDPRTKLFIFFASAICGVKCYTTVPNLAFGTVLCVILALCGKKWDALKSFLILCLVVYIRWVIDVSGMGNPVLTVVLSSLATIYLFTFPIVMSFKLIMQTTRISHFMAAFQKMRLPVQLVIPIAVLFRFIPTVMEEWNGIRKAMAFRGISMEFGAIIRKPLQTVEYVLVPLLFSSVAVMEELAAAALARGLDSEQGRTSYDEVSMKISDYIVLILFLLLMIYIFIQGA